MRHSGFSLIELLVTIAIVAILTSLAMPQYAQYVQRGRRTDALDTIQRLMDAQERYYATNAKYTLKLSDVGFSASTPGGYYSLGLSKCGTKTESQCIEVTATALGDQKSDGNIVFNTAGKRERNGKPL
ncbi:type IV pilin protein [Bacterioplanes sanyensis]|nr:type IV pilin protein [Bacterioplanes sanyensis]